MKIKETIRKIMYILTLPIMLPLYYILGLYFYSFVMIKEYTNNYLEKSN